MSTFLHYLTLHYLLGGAVVTLEITAGAFVVGLVGGLILAAIQLSGVPVLPLVVRLYAVITRGTPLLLQLLFVYDVLPTVGITISASDTAILVLGVNTSTFFSEIMRGSVTSLDRGQFLAARSLGFPPGQTARRVVLPQAARIALPQMANQVVVLILASSLASTISVSELTLRSQSLASSSFQILPVYTAAAVMYLVLTWIVSAIQLWLEWVLDLDRDPGKKMGWHSLARRWSGLVRSTSTGVLTGRPSAAASATPAAPQQAYAGPDAGAAWSGQPGQPGPGQPGPDGAVPDQAAAPEPADGAVLVEVSDLHKAYRGVPALSGIDLQVREGEVVALIGRSGCGKSTLLRAIARLEPVDSGDVLFGGASFGTNAKGKLLRGRALALAHRNVRIGMVFQHFELFQHMSALQNVMSGPRFVYRQPEATARERAEGLLANVGLSSHMRKRPHQLSGGQQQRAAIARALAIDPRLMLLDEPTSALDAEMVGEVLTVIRRLAASGMTMIIATHELPFAREVADRIVFMDAGQVVEHGPPSQILLHPATAKAREFLRLLEREPLQGADDATSA
ncbi:MAG TPA: amino acid ABC transporter permease/ATP-binding protein [Streptosporangiaceae bacterium]|nr:amino acid ABC transporter permease/ATP-binding protein [Streptosporangiaceae bacterium]